MQLNRHYDGAKARAFLDVLGILSERYPTVTVLRFRLLAMVAVHPGVTMTEIVKMAGLPQATVSSHLAGLGDKGWSVHSSGKQFPGMGLIRVTIDPQDSRRRPIFLTKKGEELCALLASLTNL